MKGVQGKKRDYYELTVTAMNTHEEQVMRQGQKGPPKEKTGV